MSDQKEQESAALTSDFADERSSTWPIVGVLVCWTLITIASVFYYNPPALDPASSANEFDSAKAMAVLEQLVGDGISHPAGSEQNKIVRQRIVSILESLGYDVESLVGTQDVPKAVAARTKLTEVELCNLIARRNSNREADAAQSEKAIALVAHFDSHPNGPGASDDGVGVAVLLEIARILAAEPEPKRNVVFLFTDGEEFFLLGAKLFAQNEALLGEIGLVINLEARGTTGPSLMFETSQMSRRLIPIFANSVNKPMCSSLFREVYKRLPRDTDFTIFRNRGILGFNFAYIGDVKSYHTTADSFENVDERSLTHHGQNALGLLRGLLAAEEVDELIDNTPIERDATSPSDEAVYFDMFGKFVVWWPANYSIWLTLACFALFRLILRPRSDYLVQQHDSENLESQGDNEEVDAKLKSEQMQERVFSLAFGLGLQIITFVAVMTFGVLLNYMVRLEGSLSNKWPAQPLPMLVGYWAACFALVGGIAIWGIQLSKPMASWSGACIIWLGMAALTSLYLPGASYLFIAPTSIAFAIGVPLAFARKWKWVFVVTAVAAGLVWLPLEKIFYDAVGFGMAPVQFFRVAMLGLLLLPLLQSMTSRHKLQFALGMVVVSAVSFVFAMLGS